MKTYNHLLSLTKSLTYRQDGNRLELNEETFNQYSAWIFRLFHRLMDIYRELGQNEQASEYRQYLEMLQRG